MRKQTTKWRWKAFAAAFIVAALFQFWMPLATTGEARCLDGDLYCQGWTPRQQQQKNRIALLEKKVAAGLAIPYLYLDACGDECVKNYDASTHGVLGRMAAANGLPYNETVKAYIADFALWAEQAERVLRRPLVKQDITRYYPRGLNRFAYELGIRQPFVLWNDDDTNYCLVPDYGGVCPGRW